MDSTHRATWDLYAASWKADGGPEKLALFAQCLARDSVYTDPLIRAEGWNALEGYMLEFQLLAFAANQAAANAHIAENLVDAVWVLRRSDV